jgi:opacity protein-like surface antigen
MKILSTRIVPILGSVSLLAAGTATAQEYFRDFGSSRSSGGIGRLGPGTEIFLGNNPNGIEPLTDAGLTQDEKNYNIRIGALDLSIAAGVAFEFNDNIALSEFNRESDIIFRPQLDIEGAIRFSETSRLRLGVGLSYAKYFDHSNYDSDSVLISPTSAITWTAETGAFKFTVRERLAYQEDPFDQPTLNVANYRRWENQAGIQVDWDANQYTKISVGYDRYDLWTEEAKYSSLDHNINTVFLRPSWQSGPHFTFGLNASYSMFAYQQQTDGHSDGHSLLVGPFVRWKVNDLTDIYAEVGFQQSSFDGGTTFSVVDRLTGLVTGTSLDTEDGTGWYAKLEIVNRPTEFLRQKLSFSKTAELGYQSNFYDLYHVEYSIDWAIREKTTIRPTFFYEYYETSGPDPENAHRFGAALGIYHVVTDNFTVGLDYRYLVKDSNRNGSDYYQNLGMVSLYYKF